MLLLELLTIQLTNLFSLLNKRPPILQVNDVNFENLSNDEAVAVLRKAVSKLGPIKLVVAKYSWLRSLNVFGKQPAENASEDTLNLRDQPVRPIDPRAWVEHTKQVNRSSKGERLPVDGR